VKLHDRLAGLSDFHLEFYAYIHMSLWTYGVITGMRAPSAKMLQGCIFFLLVVACLHRVVSWNHRGNHSAYGNNATYRTVVLNSEIMNNYHNKTWKRQN
jgi:hypothetical protein